MALVYIGIGSNVEKERHVPAVLTELKALFSSLRVSPIYESVAVGCEGANYFNLVAEFETSLSVDELQLRLKALEQKHGRKASDVRYAPRTIDLDLLLYDDLIRYEPPMLPRPEIIYNAFVLWPLAELAPDLRHPQLNQTMASLWHAFDKSKQTLSLATLQWPSHAPVMKASSAIGNKK